mgnify:CR=1 FL=1
MNKCNKLRSVKKFLKRGFEPIEIASSVVFYSALISMIYYRVIFSKHKAGGFNE